MTGDSASTPTAKSAITITRAIMHTINNSVNIKYPPFFWNDLLVVSYL